MNVCRTWAIFVACSATSFRSPTNSLTSWSGAGSVCGHQLFLVAGCDVFSAGSSFPFSIQVETPPWCLGDVSKLGDVSNLKLVINFRVHAILRGTQQCVINIGPAMKPKINLSLAAYSFWRWLQHSNGFQHLSICSSWDETTFLTLNVPGIICLFLLSFLLVFIFTIGTSQFQKFGLARINKASGVIWQESTKHLGS